MMLLQLHISYNCNVFRHEELRDATCLLMLCSLPSAAGVQAVTERAALQPADDIVSARAFHGSAALGPGIFGERGGFVERVTKGVATGG